ncbi:MAG TPA: TIGR00180 family glycosyltransferase [Burkholderiales bacterium]|nr:TIGR00180 family glycosyltransferase [Burkholderiales bacterium]
MNPDRDLTILLTLKDRAAYTFRWMDYAEQIRLPFKVLIADGGADERVPGILSDKSRYPNVNYEYLRFPYDASYADYYAKIVSALERVRTPYVVMADNDDFFVVQTLCDCVRFLAANSEFVACGGQQVIFRLDPRAGNDEHSPYGYRASWKCTPDLRSIEGKSASARLCQQAISHSDAFYDVKLTTLARQQFTTIRELGLTDLFLMESLVVFLTGIAGMIKRMDTVSIVRQHGSPGSSGGDHQQKYGGWFGRMLLPSWSGEFTRFLDVTAAGLAAADGMGAEAAREHMQRVYRMAVAPALLSDVLDEPTVTPLMSVWTTFVRCLVNLPEGSKLREFARRFYWRTRWLSADATYGIDLVALPVAREKEDLAPIQDFLTRKP